MRWIFITLVLLNGAYFGWEFWQQSQHANSTAVAAKTLPPLAGARLQLLTERLPAPSSPAPPPTISQDASAPSATQVQGSPMAASSSPGTQQVASQAETPAASATPSGSPAPGAQAKKLCTVVGPFPDDGDSGKLVQQLASVGVDAVLDSKITKREMQYWVILPPKSSRREALQTLRELQARKIDSYLIASGDLQDAISLGLFTREELAKGVQEKVKEAGYPAEIRTKERTESQFWVRIRPNQPLEKAKKVLQSYDSGDKGPKISNSACEMFAQTQ